MIMYMPLDYDIKYLEAYTFTKACKIYFIKVARDHI